MARATSACGLTTAREWRQCGGVNGSRRLRELTATLGIALGSLVVLALAGGGAAGAGTTTTRSASTTTATTTTGEGPRLAFGYDRSAPLDVVDHGVVERRGSVAVHDIEYSSGNERIQGYLVEPTRPGRLPGVVLVHGAGGTRTELLGEAIELARRGAVALTITAPSTADPLPQPTTVAQLLSGTVVTTVRDVVAVRRAADVLATRPTVDPERIGYLGWSAGAKTGAFVAAADPRFHALALLSAGADRLSAFTASAPEADRSLVRRALGSVDPIRYIALARPGTLLLEDGTRDAVVPRDALENMVRAAPPQTLVRWYPTGHALDAQAYRGAFTWLLRRLRR
jgi:dienelactone hydrolase